MKDQKMKGWQSTLLILTMISFGCASTSNYEKALNGLIGFHEDDLVSMFGTPNKTYNLPDGRTVVEYFRSRTVEENVGVPYLNPTEEYYGKKYTPPNNYINTPDIYKKVLWCKTSFVLDQDGIVTSWSHKGNDCKATQAK